MRSYEMTIRQAHEKATQLLTAQYDTHQAQRIAWWLLEAITERKQVQLVSQNAYELSDEQQALLFQWVHEHIHEHKPLAYILGWLPFCGLIINVKPPILIPRPETEEWVTHFIDELRAAHITSFSLLDVCTGSGCIALAIAQAFPDAQIYGCDIDPEALTCARENAANNNITNVIFKQSDLFDAFAGQRFDYIVANPPYIAHQEAASLAPSVTQWESPQALFADDDGYALIKKIINQAPAHFNITPSTLEITGPHLCIEIGYRQGASLSAYMKEHGYYDVHVRKDYAGHDRIICGRYGNARATANNK